jgi:hypothetical protein
MSSLPSLLTPLLLSRYIYFRFPFGLSRIITLFPSLSPCSDLSEETPTKAQESLDHTPQCKGESLGHSPTGRAE